MNIDKSEIIAWMRECRTFFVSYLPAGLSPDLVLPPWTEQSLTGPRPCPESCDHVCALPKVQRWPWWTPAFTFSSSNEKHSGAFIYTKPHSLTWVRKQSLGGSPFSHFELFVVIGETKYIYHISVPVFDSHFTIFDDVYSINLVKSY